MEGHDAGGWGDSASLKPRRIAQSRLERLLVGAEVIERDAHGVKVARLPSGIYLKLFRRKRLLSSAAWQPYARRFVRNADGLARLGVPTVHVRAYFACPPLQRHVVAYRPLDGDVLRDRVRNGAFVDWPGLARFVARLHTQGVYFRSLHSGNVVWLPDGGFGLIDIADLALRRGPLGVSRRVRNLRPLLRDPSLGVLREVGPFRNFLGAYCLAAKLTTAQDTLLRSLADRQWRRCGGQVSGAASSSPGSETGSR